VTITYFVDGNFAGGSAVNIHVSGTDCASVFCFSASHRCVEKNGARQSETQQRSRAWQVLFMWGDRLRGSLLSQQQHWRRLSLATSRNDDASSSSRSSPLLALDLLKSCSPLSIQVFYERRSRIARIETTQDRNTRHEREGCRERVAQQTWQAPELAE
jgi:hypothetical protein